MNANNSTTLEPDVVSKSGFATLCNVSPGRVTQWITERKIAGEALVGHGRKAQIRVAVAKAQLRRTLNIDQRHGNGLFTRLDPPPSAAGDAAVLPFAKPESGPDPIEERIKRERLEGLQRANRKAAEEEAARQGFYVRTDDVRQQMGRIAGQEMAVIEGRLGQIATEFAAQFQIPQRDALHLLRTEFRKIKIQASAELKAAAEALPALIEGELPATDDEMPED